MRNLRRWAAALTVAVASLGSVGVVAVATASPSGATPSCTDNWVGPTTGTPDWNTGTNWSTGVPGNADVACIQAAGTYTVLVDNSPPTFTGLVVGGAGSGTQTVEVSGASTNVSFTQTSASSEIESGGSLVLAPSTGYALMTGGGVTVDSGGSFSTTGSSSIAYLRTNVTNNGTVTIGQNNTVQDQGTTTTNNASFSVSSSGIFSVSSGSGAFTQNSGTLTNSGSLTESNGTLTTAGGSETGNPIVDTGGSITDSGMTGNIKITGSDNLTGTIPSGQTVTVSGSATNVVTTVTPGTLTVDGTLTLSPSTGYALLTGGNVTVASGGSFTTTGTTSIAYLRVNLTVDSGASATIGSNDTAQDQGTTTTNDGTVTVSSGGVLDVTSGSGAFTNNGTLTVNGSVTETNGTFTESGTAVNGANPVGITGGTLVDSTGTGAFLITGSANLTGTIPSGQTVTVSGSATNVVVGLNSGTVTDDGTLTLAPSTGYALIDAGTLDVGSGGSFTTTGALSIAYLRVNLNVASGGTATIGAANTDQDQATATVNDGTLQVANGGHLAVSSGSGSLTNHSDGTLGVTVNGPSTVYGISGNGSANISVAGTLAATTTGSPVVNDLYTAITNGVTGTFTSFSFGTDYYVVSYPAGPPRGVDIEFEQAFSATPDSFSAAENEAVTNPQVATITTNGEPGTYSATVNYGDGSGVLPATVSGTAVNGPTHTYTAPGNYTVTVVISTTAGTTQTVSESITVTGPTITGFSKTSVVSGKKLSTTVSGTNFDGTGAPSGFSTSDPSHVTVVSVKFKKATKKHPSPTYKVKLAVAKGTAPEMVSITLTQTGTEAGQYTAVNAITVT